MSAELTLTFSSNAQVNVSFEGTDSGQLPFSDPLTDKDRTDIRWYVETYGAQSLADPDDQEAKRIAARLPESGTALFNAVFSSIKAVQRFLDFRNPSAKQCVLTINSQDASVLSLPWELLHDPAGNFLFREKPISTSNWTICVAVQSHSVNTVRWPSGKAIPVPRKSGRPTPSWPKSPTVSWSRSRPLMTAVWLAKRNFAGTAHEMKRHLHVILATCVAVQEPDKADDFSAALSQIEEHGWTKLVAAIRKILSGERDAESLCGELDLQESQAGSRLCAASAWFRPRCRNCAKPCSGLPPTVLLTSLFVASRAFRG